MKTFPNMEERIMELLEKYEMKDGIPYNPTEQGIQCALDEFYENKRPLIEAFETYPTYDGDGKIILNESMYCERDEEVIGEFYRYIRRILRNRNIAYPREGDIVEIMEISDTYHPLYNRTYMSPAVGNRYSVVTYDPRDQTVLVNVSIDNGDHYIKLWFHERWVKVVERNGEPVNSNELFDMDLLPAFDKLINFDQFVTDEQAQFIREYFPFKRAHRGEKLSRIVRQLCVHYGFDKDSRFNTKFTRYADAVNPLKINMWTILSLNPIDFLTMSFGYEWASCHTIDKTNIRRCKNSYHGMYSSGTLSYMLDGVSFVVYTVDKSYTGNQYELQPKINRQMFAYDNEKLLQGRLYPQDNDTRGKNLYKQFREIVQRTISQCLWANNYWQHVSGTEVCKIETVSCGTHYCDYEYFENCGISYHTNDKDNRNHEPIYVGHDPICLSCGEEHENQGCIMCEGCERDIVCNYCGDAISGDAIHIVCTEIYFCCENCAREAGYVYCENVDEWHYADAEDVLYDCYYEMYMYDLNGYWPDRVIADNGYTFINEESAREAGYVYDNKDGKWHYEEERSAV